MANTLINQKLDRIKTYSGILQAEVGGNTFQYKFVQDIEITIDDEFLERDFVDDGVAAFTRIGDILGRFKFAMKNTVDLYDSVTPATNTKTVSFWKQQIKNEAPAEVVFIEKKKAPESTGNKFARTKFTGRITKVFEPRTREVAVQEVEIEGEITVLTEDIRVAS